MTKILIIEDEEALLTMLADKLEREGYEVIMARDGEEGLSKLRKEKPELVLLDIVMPKVGGLEVLGVMHADKELSNIPVIIISNSGQPIEIEKAKRLGAKDCLVKAEFDPKEVVEKVNNLLGNMNNAKNKEVFSKELGGGGGESSEELLEQGSSQKKGVSLSSSAVLVVEDDQFLRDLIVKKLEHEGIKTIQAIDGEEGLRLARENKPGLILLDLILPGIDGFVVLKQIKDDPSISGIPVVILSNLGQKEDIERGFKLGAKDYLIKAHFAPGEIVQKVKEAMKGK